MASTRNEVQTVSDLRCALTEIEKEFLLNSNKLLLTKLCKGFTRLTVPLEQKQPGIDPIVISWFELYLKVQNFIDRKDEKLMQQYVKTVPIAISYIIGCLQYNPKDNFTFHCRLLEIIDALLRNISPNVIKECSTLPNGTIACLWKPIKFAPNFNTQTLALKIFAQLLKNFDANRVESELKAIKWSNLSLFKDKLNRVIEGTSQLFTYENACRELLNNFNMELTGNIFIYSLDCKSVVMGTEFEFYKPLIMEKFWIDLNFRPKTISFKGGHKLKMHLEFQDFEVNLKWKNIQLKNDCLVIAIEKTQDSVLPPHIVSKIKKHDKLVLYLTDKEIQSFKNNKDMMQYPGLMEESEVDVENTEENAPEITSPCNSNNDKNMPESPVPPRNNSITNKKHYFLRQKTPRRKFFTAIKEEDMKLQKQTKKKNSNKKLSKILKPRIERKSVCKVVPVIVDLTNTPEHVDTRPLPRTSHNRLGGTNGKLTVKQCLKILNAVSDTSIRHDPYYNYDESDAEPCQSYRDFKAISKFAAGSTERTTNTSSGALHGKTLAKDDKPLTVCPVKTDFHRFKNANGSNNENISRPQNGNKRKLVSQDIFDQLKDEGSISSGPSKRTRQCSIENIKTENTLGTNEHLSEFEQFSLADLTNLCSTPLRSPQFQYPKTPPSTNTMDVSGINNTVNEMDTSDHFLLKKPRTENKITNYSLFGADTDVAKKAFIDDQISIETKNAKFDKENQLAKKINYSPVLTSEETCKPKDCVIYKTRLESDDSDSENENGDFERYDLNSLSEAKTGDSTNWIPANKETHLKEVVNKDTGLQTYIHQTKAVANQPEINTTKTVLYNSDVKSILLNNDTYNKKLLTLYFQSLRGSLIPNRDINENNQKRDGSKIATEAADYNMVQESLQKIQREKNKEYKLIGQSVETQTVHLEYSISTKTKSLISKHKECLTNTTDVLQASHVSVNREPYLNVKESQLMSNDSGSLNLMLEEREYMNKEPYLNVKESQLMSNDSRSLNLMLEEREYMNKDLYEMKEHYAIKIENMLNVLRPQCVTGTFTATKSKLCALAENIVKQSNEHVKGLQLLQATMQRLLRQMECQYELYVKRNDQFQCFEESAELILDTFGCFSLQSDISNKYQDVIDKLNVAELKICKEIWQKCFAVKKENLMRTIDYLSEL